MALNPAPPAAPNHDISTDTANPPSFQVLDDTRAGASNTLGYAGPELAAAQAAAYPDIAPLATDLPADAAYLRALKIAEDMGWDIVASDPETEFGIWARIMSITCLSPGDPLRSAHSFMIVEKDARHPCGTWRPWKPERL